ncbi:MAG TPA: LLM class flavin-dependent oxidoreductase [Streptosporangiaceae bacterium]|nr:LLM class flavin-dependent oxidoreductase [Streptosporangiaceae bacterium]
MTTAVSIGLFLDLRNPLPWRVPSDRLLARTVDVVRRAEALGADSVWSTEHHLFEDGYLSQPLTLAAVLAAKTERLRIGTAVLVAPLRHPRHIAEQAALVDAVSGGRLELGLGAGYAAAEFAAFGAERSRRFAATDAAYCEVRRLLATGGLGPGPVQHPVPMWLGYQGPQGAARAGRLGAGLLTLNRASLEPYRAALREHGHPEDAARMSGSVDLIVSSDPERAWARIRPHYAHQALTYLRAHDPKAEVPAAALASRLGATRHGLASVRLSVLTPDEALTEIRHRIDGLPAAHVYTWASIANMPGDLVDEHVELLFGDVAPRLRRAGD